MGSSTTKVVQGQVNLLLESIENMRLNQQLTDVILRCNGRQFHAHKLILAASSPYFKAMFVSANKTFPCNKTIEVEDVQPEIIEMLLRFMNTGKIDLVDGDLEMAELLLEAADQLQIVQAVTFVWEMLHSSISTKNFIRIWNLATKFDREDAKDKVLQFEDLNFEAIRNTDAFLAMSGQQFNSFYYNVISKDLHHDMLLQMILKWVKHDQCNRIANFPALLSRIKFSSLSDEYLAEIAEQKSVLKEFPKLVELIVSTVSYRFVISQ